MEKLPVILEAVMIICFGLSWPLSIIKAYRARTAKGTSIFFMSFIEFGYVCGIVAKILLNTWNWITIVAFCFYILNLLMVSTGIMIYFRNRKIDRMREEKQKGCGSGDSQNPAQFEEGRSPDAGGSGTAHSAYHTASGHSTL